MLLTNNEPPLLRPILPSDLTPAPTESLLESLTIPTPNQMITQSQTIEPTPDETASDSPNRESTATETHDIAHHPIEIPAQSQPPQQQLPPEVWNKMNKSQRKHWRNGRHK